MRYSEENIDVQEKYIAASIVYLIAVSLCFISVKKYLVLNITAVCICCSDRCKWMRRVPACLHSFSLLLYEHTAIAP